jgi:putative ABC transport system permease protein
VTFPVKGVAVSAEYLWPARSRQDSMPIPDNFGVVYATDAVAAGLTGPVATREALVLYDDGADHPALAAQLTRLAAATGAGTKGVGDRDTNPSNTWLQADLAFFGDMAVSLPVIFLLASGVATYVLLARKVRADLPIVGTMLALGCSRRQVIGQYLGYGAAAGAVGAVPGVIVGALLGRLMTFMYAEILSLPSPRPEFQPATMALGLVVGVSSAVLAALAPAFTAARIEPAEAGRTVAPPGRGRASLAERLLPPVRRLPTRWRAVLRGAERNWRRTLSTVVGVTMATGLVVSSWAMLDSTRAWFDAMEDTNRHDVRVVFDGGATHERLAALAATPGIAAVERTVQLPVLISSAGREGADARNYQTFLVGQSTSTRMHGFRVTGAGPDALPEEGVLAGVALSDLLGVEKGDQIRLTIDPGDGSPPVVMTERLAGFVNEPIGTFAYLSLDRLGPLPPALVTAGSVGLATYTADADEPGMQNRLSALDGVSAVEENENFLQSFQSYMAFFYVMVGFMIVFGAAMALALVYASISVNLAERSIEMAALRAEGVRLNVLSRLVTAENLLITVLGLPPGIYLGFVLAKPLLGTFTNDLWRFDLVVNPLTPVLASIAVVGAAVLSQWPGLRAIRRLDIASVVRLRTS